MTILYHFKKKLLNKLVKETLWSFAAKGIAFLFFFSMNIYLARTLGVENFGTWSFFFSVLTIIILLSYFGINASTRKYVAQYNETIELNNVLKSSIKIRLIFSSVFAILILLIHQPLAIIIGKPEFATLFLFASPLILLTGLVEFLKHVFMGVHRIKYNFIINTFEFGLKLILVVLFLTFSLNLLNIVYAFTIATFITSISGFYIISKKIYKKHQKGKEKYHMKDIIRYSIPLFFVSIGFLLITEIDILMIGLLSTDKEVGIYSVAKQIIIKLSQISLAIAMGTMPIFAKLDTDNKDRLKGLFYRLLRLNTLIYSIISIIIVFFSYYFIPLIYGNEYFASVLPLQILTIFLICITFAIFLSLLLDYQGLAKKRAFYLSIVMMLGITLNFILIPPYGAVGAAIATSLSFLPYIFLCLFEVKRVLNRI